MERATRHPGNPGFRASQPGPPANPPYGLPLNLGVGFFEAGLEPDPFSPAVRIMRECFDRGINRGKVGAFPSPGLLVVYRPGRRVTDHLSEVVEVPSSIYVLQKKGSVGFRY